MKKLLLVLCLFVVIAGSAVESAKSEAYGTIYGRISWSPGNGCNGCVVTVRDVLFNRYYYVTTNSSGYWSAFVPAGTEDVYGRTQYVNGCAYFTSIKRLWNVGGTNYGEMLLNHRACQ